MKPFVAFILPWPRALRDVALRSTNFTSVREHKQFTPAREDISQHLRTKKKTKKDRQTQGASPKSVCARLCAHPVFNMTADITEDWGWRDVTDMLYVPFWTRRWHWSDEYLLWWCARCLINTVCKTSFTNSVWFRTSVAPFIELLLKVRKLNTGEHAS